MKQYLYLALILFASIAHARAQSPGYLGRHIILSPTIGVGVKAYTYDRLYNALRYDDPNNSPFVPIVGLHLQGIVSRRYVIGLQYERSRVAFQEDSYFGGEYFRSTTRVFSFTNRVYPFRRKGALAPMGTYSNIQLQLVFLGLEEFRQLKASRPVHTEQAIYPGFSFGLGKSWLIAGRLLMDFELVYSLTTPSALMGLAFDPENTELPGLSTHKYTAKLSLGWLQ